MTESDATTFTKPLAVIDSNVLLEVVSTHDLARLYNAPSNTDPAGEVATLRRQRARESLLLAVHLNRIKAATYSIFEPFRIVLKKVDPSASDNFEYHAITIWAHYIKDRVLPGWAMLNPSNGDDEPQGSHADSLLVERAKEYGVPLISHEGASLSGVDHGSGIRKKAVRSGVQVMTAREFYGKADEAFLSESFMQRYAEGADAYIRTVAHPKVMRDSMLWLQGYYRHILYGITNGFKEPLPVRLW
jgi:hypothetical protein